MAGERPSMLTAGGVKFSVTLPQVADMPPSTSNTVPEM
jgi:hypothetical protein